jgi:predicted ATP-grasp superfamily ATP-dependent carboligase
MSSSDFQHSSDTRPPIRQNANVREHVLLTGISTRAAAESAARAGFDVTAIDAFADRDQHPRVRAYSCARDFNLPFGVRSLVRAAASMSASAVAYLSPVENVPSAVASLARARVLWGNSPDVLTRVRNPVLLHEVLSRQGVVTPQVWTGAGTPDPSGGRRWLVKPVASGGGGAVRVWRPGAGVARSAYLQESIDGTVGSVVFVAAAGRARVFALSRQLVGDPAFGATGFRYCGSILAASGDPQFSEDDEVFAKACDAADIVTREFGLVGINGLDFVARDGTPFAIEVNPRWSSSMEVAERAYGINVFGMHADACTSNTLSTFDVTTARRVSEATGRAVVYARSAIRADDTDAWLRDPDTRDVPHPGDVIEEGKPICSVFATGRDAQSCYLTLVERARQIYAVVSGWGKSG